MTTTVVRYEVDDGTTVQFEVEPFGGFQPAGAKELVGRLAEAVEPAVAGAKVLLEKVKELGPEEVQVTFGIKATGTMNWVVARAATEGNFEVTMKWTDPSKHKAT